MNILIIGNGFDIAHKLPTRYKDFLEVCATTKKAGKYWDKDKTNADFAGINKRQRKIHKSFCSKVEYPLWAEFYDIGKTNFWISYLQERKTVVGENWIDFEEEIRVVMESAYRSVEGSLDRKVDIFTITNLKLREYCERHNYHRKRPYRELFSELLNANKRLIRAMEIYMDGYIYKLDVKQLPYISSKDIDKVLSFNYTVTYTEHYNPRVDCCYIHGKADVRRSIDDCNLVLGYDDHYVEGVKAVPELIPFEKYYQRIVNRNDKQYFDWIDEINNSKEDSTVYIYGHSLGATDGDVLRKFILNDHVRVKIYYYSETDRAEKIKNLAVVLEPDNLIKLTGGSNPVIEFETAE